MAHPRWREAKLSTGFIAEEYPDGFAHPVPQGDVAQRIAAVGAAIDHVLGERRRKISGQMIGRTVTRERRRFVRLGMEEVPLDIAREGDALVVRFDDGKAHRLASSWKPGDLVWRGTLDGETIAVQVRTIVNGFRLAHRGIETAVHVFTETEAAAARLMPAKPLFDSGKKLLCPMPGLVVSIAVSEGQEIKAGETLAIVEAMKMENVLRAERDGVVKVIHTKPGATLAVDAVIMEFN